MKTKRHYNVYDTSFGVPAWVAGPMTVKEAEEFIKENKADWPQYNLKMI